jgi:four helix bundle protein
MDGDTHGFSDPLASLDETQRGYHDPRASREEIREKSFDFALEIIYLFGRLRDSGEGVVSRKLLESGTAVGAIVERAMAAGDAGEHARQLRLALEQARETAYWLRLFHRSDLVRALDVMPNLRQANDLVRLLTVAANAAEDAAASATTAPAPAEPPKAPGTP